MADLSNLKCISNTKFEILTEQGFKNFKGLLIGENNNRYLINFDNGATLKCTPGHKLIDIQGNNILAKNIKVGDILYNNIRVIDIQQYTSTSKVYEFLEVEDCHTYFVNSILSHQCLLVDEMAFIDCVHGNTTITLRNKNTGAIYTESIMNCMKILSQHYHRK
jgi:hypothetical protein